MKKGLIFEEVECNHNFIFRTTERKIELNEDDIHNNIARCYDIINSSTSSLYEFLVELYNNWESHCICDYGELKDIENNRDKIVSLLQQELKSRLDL